MKVPARKLTDTVQLKLRIREELRRKLERAAIKREVSLNTEMVERLEASFKAAELFDEIKGAIATNMSPVTAELEWLRRSQEQLNAQLQRIKKEGGE
jgi:DNA-binding transcriptional regulator GbsR (MarR family)